MRVCGVGGHLALAQLEVGAHKSSFLGPSREEFGVWYHNAD